MSLTSTVPAAVSLLKTKMQAVATANPSLAPGVYVGQIIGTDVANNFLAIGDPAGGGQLVAEYGQQFDGMYSIPPARRIESYGITGMIRAWDETVDPIARLTDAFTLLNGLITQLADDPEGSDQLTTMGSWGVTNVENPVLGKIDSRGCGCILTFTVTVSDAQLLDH